MQTVVGAVEINRQYETCPKCKGHQYGFDETIEWRHTHSEKLRDWVALCSQAEPFDEGRALLAELTGVELGHRTVETISEEMGAQLRAEEDHAISFEAEPEGPEANLLPPYLCIVIDAVKAPCEEWRDVKVATIFGWVPGETERKGERIAPEYIFGVEHWERFGRRVEIAARNRGSHSGIEVVVIGDGANWIWDLADKYFPHARQIVDWYHAVEHLWEVGRALYGEGDACQAWVEQRKAELWVGDVKKVVAMMGYARSGMNRRPGKTVSFQALKTIDNAQQYFRVRRERMGYNIFRQQGLFIGSGTVEAACKTLVTTRAKRSGMRWSLNGLIAILKLRSLRLSAQWHLVSNNQLAA